MVNNYPISINFSSLKTQNFEFTIYRKKKKENEEKKGFDFYIQQRRLPINLDNQDDLSDYWVSYSEQIGFEKYICHSNTNISLTLNYLNIQLVQKCYDAGLRENEDFFIYRDRKGEVYNENIVKVYFVNQSYLAGKQCVWLKAGYLEVGESFGFYSDFQFKKTEGFTDFKQVQKLSLSLNNYGYSNINYYANRYEQLIKFAKTFYSKIFLNSILDFGKQEEIENVVLSSKVYLFKNEAKGANAIDLKKLKPYKGIESRVKIYFVVTRDEKIFIKNSFEKINQSLVSTYDLKIDYESFEIESINIESVKPLIEKIEIEKTTNADTRFLVFFPIRDNGLSYYYECKYYFDYNNIPIQFARYQTLKENNPFSFDGLTLQMFTKLGGIPWEMQPTNDKCLIVGLAQANPIIKNYKKAYIKRHFAYSVLLNSRGVYKSLEVFSNEITKEEYLEKLRLHILKIITEYSSEYKKIVIHTPFKIKDEELEKINQAVIDSNITDIDFVVIRINTENDYFGYNKLQKNSLTPLESSTVKIGKNQYLIWFEGLKNINENPTKRFAGPTFVEFHFPHELTEEKKYSYIQDLINLSGANWRGFKAKSQPISIYYCKLVTEFIKQFREIGLTELDFKNFQPWFL